MKLPAVVCDPKVMLGKPVIAGTRITVELLLERLADGDSPDAIRLAYPHLPEGSVEAALQYAQVRSPATCG